MAIVQISQKKTFGLSLIMLIFLFYPLSVSAQVVLRNPGLPEIERSVYKKTDGGTVTTISTVLEYKKDENNTDLLEYRSYSSDQDIFIRLNAATLETFYSEVWDRRDGNLVHSKNELLKNNAHPEGDELLITDMYGFTVTLRGFPWEQENSAKLVFLRNRGGFSMELKVKGKEKLSIQGKSYECWKIQIGINGFMGTIFPKSYYWYTVKPPHFLVKSEEAGMPGKSKVILELQSYSSN